MKIMATVAIPALLAEVPLGAGVVLLTIVTTMKQIAMINADV